MEGRTGHKKGLWTAEEDRILTEYIKVHGKGKWNWVAKMTGLKRSGRSCRLRWINYLSPTVKRGGFSEEEDDLIIRLHNLLGNRWSLISGRVPGRTDNQVKNHWNTHLSKKNNTVKKIKVNFGASSPTTVSSIKEGERFSVPTMVMERNTRATSDGSIGGACQNQITNGLFGVEEPIMINEGCKTSFQFSTDDPNLDTPSLMELLDQYAPDLFVMSCN